MSGSGGELSPEHLDSLAPATRQLAAALAARPWAADFYLAGSAGLALHLAHRPVVGLDLMGGTARLTSPERRDLLADLLVVDPGIEVETARDGFLSVRSASGVPVRFFHYPYPLVDPVGEALGLAVASPVDLGLMKLAAIVSRGTRRDFLDLHLLCRHLPLPAVLARAGDKFGHVRDFPLQALKGLADFESAPEEPLPVSATPVDWAQVAAWTRQEVRDRARAELRLERPRALVEAAAGRPFRSSLGGPVLDAMQKGALRSVYRGVPFLKDPLDIGLYIQLFTRLAPRTVIEIGTKHGGSALFFADLLDREAAGGEVITIDLEPRVAFQDDRIRVLTGDARDLGAVLPPARLRELPHPILVCEDSSHLFETSLAVLEFFDPWLEPGDYIVIEDGILSQFSAPRYEAYQDGPNRAVAAFLEANPDRYVIDATLCDHYGYNATFHPNGWLRREDGPPPFEGDTELPQTAP